MPYLRVVYIVHALPCPADGRIVAGTGFSIAYKHFMTRKEKTKRDEEPYYILLPVGRSVGRPPCLDGRNDKATCARPGPDPLAFTEEMKMARGVPPA